MMGAKQPVYRITKLAQGNHGIVAEVINEETKKRFKVSANALLSEYEYRGLPVRDMYEIWYGEHGVRMNIREVAGRIPVTAVERTEDGWKVKRVEKLEDAYPWDTGYYYMSNDEIRGYLEDGNLYVFNNLKLSVDHKVIQGKPKKGVSSAITGKAKLNQWGSDESDLVDIRAILSHEIYQPKPEMVYTDTPKAFGNKIDAFLDDALAYLDDYYGSRYLGVQRYLGADAKEHKGPVVLCARVENIFIDWASYLAVDYNGKTIVFRGTGALGGDFTKEFELGELKHKVKYLADNYLHHRTDKRYSYVRRAMFEGVENSEIRELISLSGSEESLIEEYNNGSSEDSEDAYYTLERLSSLRARYGTSYVDYANVKGGEAAERMTAVRKKEEAFILEPFRPTLEEEAKKLYYKVKEKYGTDDGTSVLRDVVLHNFKQPYRPWSEDRWNK